MLFKNFDEIEHHNSISFLHSIMIDQPFLNIMIVNSVKGTKDAIIGQSKRPENLCISYIQSVQPDFFQREFL